MEKLQSRQLIWSVCIGMLLVGTLLAGGCTHEDNQPPAPGPGIEPGTNMPELTLEVRIPGMFAPKTYAMSEADENKVGELTLLAYNDNAGIKTLTLNIPAIASDIIDDYSGNIIVKMAVPAGKYDRLVLVANANQQVSSLQKGSDISQLYELEYMNDNDKWNISTPQLIPMSAVLESGTANGLDITNNRTFKNLRFIRMLARIDIINQTYPTFVLDKVYIYNMNRNGYIVSDNAKYEASPKEPNIPGTLTKTNDMMYRFSILATGESVKKMEREIYVFEAERPTQTNISTSVRIVIEGAYNSRTYYYPVDFTDNTTGEFMPVIRNHKYIFTITQVVGEGFTDANEALNYQGSFTNITAQLLVVDDDFTDVYYNGQNFLAVNATGANILMGPDSYNTATDDNTLSILTDVDSFTIKCYNSDNTPAAESTLKPDADNYVGGLKKEAFLIADYLTIPGNEFEGYIVVEAGALKSEKIHVKKLWCGKDGIPLMKTIGNNKYKTHRYGTQCWMVENSREGTGSGKAYGLDWTGANIGNISSDGSPTYRGNLNGYYYTWTQATQPDNACPAGWHLPNIAEWNDLRSHVNNDIANNKSSIWWAGSKGNANNAFAGNANSLGSSWKDWGQNGLWWIDSMSEQCINGHTSGLQNPAPGNAGDWLSVRCIQD